MLQCTLGRCSELKRFSGYSNTYPPLPNGSSQVHVCPLADFSALCNRQSLKSAFETLLSLEKILCYPFAIGFFP